MQTTAFLAYLQKIASRIFAAAFLLLIFFSSVSLAAVTVTGQGSSERNALHDAMRQAIETEVGAYIDSRTYIDNYQMLNDRIYAQSAGYIKSYEVLNKHYANGIYSVTIIAYGRMS